ncbi:MAG TPA: sugar ABC transporter permease, partial [Clostridia bacterium]|nr:sugar ABC transporter permease [Clostridia bacterium]
MQAVRKRASFRRYFRENWIYYLMSLPGLIYVVGYKFLPLYGLTLAFKKYNMFAGTGLLDSIAKSAWVGFAHFRVIFGGDQFWILLRNTLLVSAYKIAILTPLPILLALLMNEMRSRFVKKGIQTLIYLPHFLSWVIIYGIFFTLLSSDGVINRLLHGIGAQPVMFFTDARLFRSLLVATEGWKESGWGTIVYLAALTGI